MIGHGFGYTITFDGQRYDCGTFINRAEAMKAGKLFVDRKEGERHAADQRAAFGDRQVLN